MSGFLLAALGLLATLGMTAIGDMVSQEVRDRLDHLPHAILRLAARRLGPALREDVYDEWVPELTFILKGDEARPISRLYHGTRFALGILTAARRIATGLACSPELAVEAHLVIGEGLAEFAGIRDACAFVDDQLGLVEAALADKTAVSEAALAAGVDISDPAWALLNELVCDGRLRAGDLLSHSASVIQVLRKAQESVMEPGGRISSRDVEQLRDLNADIRRVKADTARHLGEALASLLGSARRTSGSSGQPKN